MSGLVLIRPRCRETETARRLDMVLEQALAQTEVSEMIDSAADLHPWRGQRVLFAVALGSCGVNLEYCAMLQRLRREPQLFEGCLGALLVDGDSELYTKNVARELVLAANLSGCAFIGRPLVEGTQSLDNFNIVAQVRKLDALGAYKWSAHDLVQRLLAGPPLLSRPRHLLVLHASTRSRSNTYALWNMVRPGLSDMEVQEISLRKKEVDDCGACSYATCLHFGSQGACFYGGAITEEVYPAVGKCTDLLLLCPNYNDALSANLTAFINRLTALFLCNRFYDKRLWALIVSGYSGGDIIAGQLIAALNMNKSFFLPPRFCLTATAYDKGSVVHLPHIKEQAAGFAATMNRA